MTRITIDPLCRIEGHLRIEAEVDANNTVTDAWSCGTLWRGLELILEGRAPQDAPLLTQRICGVCTYSHYEASTSALETALGVTPPKNARIIRNLIKAAQWLHDHVMHFYVLNGPDWMDLESAVSADPVKTAALAASVTDTPYNASRGNYESAVKKLKSLCRQGPFANAYWGHSAYKLSPEANLIIAAHYLDALSIQRTAARAMAIFGGKNPHPQCLIIGGVTCVVDALDETRVNTYLSLMQEVQDFVERAYLPDLLLVASAYKDEGVQGIGAGCQNLLTYGCFPAADNAASYLFSSGVIIGGSLANVSGMDPEAITEQVKHSWYEDSDAGRPAQSSTTPCYTGFDASGNIDGEGKYSWIKAPRYNDMPMEVGPLARIMLGYARADALLKPVVDDFLTKTGLPVQALFSALGRTVARGLETVILGRQVSGWVQALLANISSGDTTFWTPCQLQSAAEGFWLGDVPRGGLGHWVQIQNGTIAHYQLVVPSTWNASPRDANGVRGPYEQSLIGLKVADPAQPVEIIRTIHSFDPCLACAVHILTPRGEMIKFKIL